MKNNGFLIIAVLFAALLMAACSRNGSEDLSESTANTTNTAGGTESAPMNQAHPGESLYLSHCASCHDQAMYKAPSRLFVSMIGPENILNSMNGGLMAEQASNIDDEGRRAIAEYLTGQSLKDLVKVRQPPNCDAGHGFDPSLVPVASGFGVDPENTRFQPSETGGLTVADVSNLEVKWAFAYPNSYMARSEPVFGEALSILAARTARFVHLTQKPAVCIGHSAPRRKCEQVSSFPPGPQMMRR